MTMYPLMHHVSWSFLAKHQITQVTQPPYSTELVPCDFWFFPKLKSPLKGKRFQPLRIFRKIWQGRWWWLGELCEVLWCLLWRGLRRHCLNVWCFLYVVSFSKSVPIFYSAWLDTFWTVSLSFSLSLSLHTHTHTHARTHTYMQIFTLQVGFKHLVPFVET